MDKDAPKKNLNISSGVKDTDNLNMISSQEALVEKSLKMSKIVEVKLSVEKTTHNKEENLPPQSLTSSSECSSIKKNTDEFTKELSNDLKVIDHKNNSCSTNDQNESKTETENDHSEKMIEKMKEPKQSNGQNENMTDSKESTEKKSINKNEKIKANISIDDIDYYDAEEIRLYLNEYLDVDDSYDKEITLKNKMPITKIKKLKEPYWENGFLTYDLCDSTDDEEIVCTQNKIDDDDDVFSGVMKGNTKKTEENNDENNQNETENNEHKMRNSYSDEKSDVIIVDQKIITNDIDKDDEKNVNEKDKVENVSGTTENEDVVLDGANDQHMEDISEKLEENDPKLNDEKESGGKLSEDDIEEEYMSDISEKLEENDPKLNDEKELEGKLSEDKDEEKKLTSDNGTNEDLKRKKLLPPENCCKKLKRLNVDRNDIVDECIERKETETETVEGDRKQSSHLDEKIKVENVSGTTDNEAVVLDNANDQHMEDISEKPEENNQKIDDEIKESASLLKTSTASPTLPVQRN